MKQGLTMWVSRAVVVLRVAATLASLCFAPRGLTLASAASGTQAIKANDFLESLGAVTHIIQGIDSATSVQAGIQYLGIRNIRDDGTTNSSLVRALCSIHSATGAMVDEL